MAAMGATISPYFSKSTTTTTCIIRSKHISSDFVLRLACMRTLQVASISHSHSHSLDSFSIAPISHKFRNSRISAAVAQEELAGSIQTESPDEEILDVKEEVEEEEEVEVKTPLNTKLYFGNLPYNCDSAQLAGIIQEYGSPEMVEVLYDRDTGRSRGFAFVTMSSMEDAKAVIQNLDGSEYGGRTLKVNFSDKPKPKEPLYPETDHKLFVGNLTWSVTSEILTQAFQEHGNVVGARVLYDGDTGRSRGYGFVCYSSKLEMEAALESLNGVELEGREMRVSLAQGKRTYK